jgi:hypothetical protein
MAVIANASGQDYLRDMCPVLDHSVLIHLRGGPSEIAYSLFSIAVYRQYATRGSEGLGAVDVSPATPEVLTSISNSLT